MSSVIRYERKPVLVQIDWRALDGMGAGAGLISMWSSNIKALPEWATMSMLELAAAKKRAQHVVDVIDAAMRRIEGEHYEA